MLNPSRLYLPKLDNPPPTMLDYLYIRFPHLERSALKTRVIEGKIFLEDRTAISTDTPYKSGITLFYYREAIEEPQIPFSERVIFQNQHILIADKPHFIPVTPSGPYVNQCLLSRLQKATGLDQLSPIHRLDMGTAGIVLFSLKRETRHLYHRLFAEGRVKREYSAVASIPHNMDRKEWVVENRIVRGEPWFRMQIAEGEINAITRIILLECRGDKGLFELLPATGKKHQLRIHLNSLGFPVINDPFYPEVRNDLIEDYSKPLQLVAGRLSFQDPISGESMKFESEYRLEW
jgi:tRNA pseudouridine32 synthase / 23S rRNA pseudouridine746 synthase